MGEDVNWDIVFDEVIKVGEKFSTGMIASDPQQRDAPNAALLCQQKRVDRAFRRLNEYIRRPHL